MERTNHQITLPSGKTAQVVDWLTAKEVREITAMTYKSVGISQKTEPNAQGKLVTTQEPTFDAAIAIEGEENKLVSLAVVSFDGSPDHILDRLLDGQYADWQAVLAESKKLVTPT